MKFIVYIFLSLFSYSTLCQAPDSLLKANDNSQKEKLSRSKTLYGIASFYADKFEGRKTATGAIYTHNKLTAACNVLPLRTWSRQT